MDAVGFVKLNANIVVGGINADASPPVMPPVTVGAGQVYLVPDGIMPSVTFPGVITKPPPLQVEGVKIVVTFGVGLTLTITLSDDVAAHPFAETLNKYVTGIIAFVELVKTSLITPVEPVDIVGAVMLTTGARDHVNVAPVGVPVAVYENVEPLQIAVGGKSLVNLGC